MPEKIIVIHGEKRLKKEIDKYCTECSKRRSQWDWCDYKNQRACKKVQAAFKGKIHGELKEMYIYYPTMIKVEA
jgi:hypothetical protein